MLLLAVLLDWLQYLRNELLRWGLHRGSLPGCDLVEDRIHRERCQQHTAPFRQFDVAAGTTRTGRTTSISNGPTSR